jgi:hypothetical protein
MGCMGVESVQFSQDKFQIINLKVPLLLMTISSSAPWSCFDSSVNVSFRVSRYRLTDNFFDNRGARHLFMT